MSFIANANPPASTAEPTVSNDGWFPELAPTQVRDACRLDGTVTTARLLPALKAAMLSVNAELAEWAAEQRARWGYAQLADVPAPQVGGESAKLLHYRRAVHECLQADLQEAYRESAATKVGGGGEEAVREALAAKVEYHRKNQRWAIADLVGRARCTVELL